ncbi:MAG: ATP-binding protein, partial [Eubacteriaceae bacterium]|nr:ATP-binding protein [Eubacteriaceae bacterium]
MQFKENDRTEFKEIINVDFKKEIVAFANTNGGNIYVGVSDDGAIVGIENADKEMQRITSMIHDGIHPDLIPYTS